MKKITDIKELRNIQMDILSYVDNLCRKNGIRYSISGGTLIGAVRHKGYIPWDDDIDIMLTRDAYENLIEVISKEFQAGASRYAVLTHAKDKSYRFPFAKIVDTRTVLVENIKGVVDNGVYIDVFPIDYIPEGTCNFVFTRMKFLYSILNSKRIILKRERAFVKNFIILASRVLTVPIPSGWLIKRMENIAVHASKTPTSNRACLVWGYGKREIVPASVHEEYIDIPFEDRIYMSIKDYDTYLTNLYGDYMKLPPVEKQMTHHSFVAYWKD